MARLREPAPASVPDRPDWLNRFSWLDWNDPDAPLPPEPGGINTGSQADPTEAAWLRRVLAARHRWNAAREAWFFEHGQAADGYRVRLTGRTPNDRPDEELN